MDLFELHVFEGPYSQQSLLDSAKIAILVVCSRNMASYFLIIRVQEH